MHCMRSATKSRCQMSSTFSLTCLHVLEQQLQIEKGVDATETDTSLSGHSDFCFPLRVCILLESGIVLMIKKISVLTSKHGRGKERTMMNNTAATNYTVTAQFREPFRITLITIYSIVLLVGSAGLTLMMSILKTNIRSLTTTVFLNLMVAHFLFLLTVPFRIYYYVSLKWHLPHNLCKMVSAMIHIHMYMVFIIYAIVLTLRFLQYYKKTQRTEFYRRLHAVGASACLWAILLVVMLPTVVSQYGHKDQNQDTDQCFNFDNVLSHKSIYALNMTLSVFIAGVSFVLTCLQTIVLCSFIRKHGATSRFQQEFWVQMKNLCFVFIMLICLVPYHLFRIHYLNQPTKPHEINEVFLAITALTCCDMLTFTGKGMCHMC